MSNLSLPEQDQPLYKYAFFGHISVLFVQRSSDNEIVTGNTGKGCKR